MSKWTNLFWNRNCLNHQRNEMEWVKGDLGCGEEEEEEGEGERYRWWWSGIVTWNSSFELDIISIVNSRESIDEDSRTKYEELSKRFEGFPRIIVEIDKRHIHITSRRKIIKTLSKVYRNDKFSPLSSYLLTKNGRNWSINRGLFNEICSCYPEITFNFLGESSKTISTSLLCLFWWSLLVALDITYHIELFLLCKHMKKTHFVHLFWVNKPISGAKISPRIV